MTEYETENPLDEPTKRVRGRPRRIAGPVPDGELDPPPNFVADRAQIDAIKAALRAGASMEKVRRTILTACRLHEASNQGQAE